MTNVTLGKSKYQQISVTLLMLTLFKPNLHVNNSTFFFLIFRIVKNMCTYTIKYKNKELVNNDQNQYLE